MDELSEKLTRASEHAVFDGCDYNERVGTRDKILVIMCFLLEVACIAMLVAGFVSVCNPI